MNRPTPENIEKKFTKIYEKFNNGDQLTLEEEETLGLLKLINLKDIHKLDEKVFTNYKFKHLYLIYFMDLSFKGEYYKPNFEVLSSKILDYKKIHKLNKNEFNQEAFNQIQTIRRATNIEIRIQKKEIEKDKIYLDKVAIDWAKKMIYEKHHDGNLKILSKETRDTIKKVKIQNFLDNSLLERENIDVKKAILKSKYVHLEALKIFTKIGKKEIKYKLDNVDVFFNYGTMIHILNRHFAQILSNQNISKSKTFHSTKIDPYKLDTTLFYIFKKINIKKAMKGLVKADSPIFLKYKNQHYVIYLKVDKFYKLKLNINTFYQIDGNSLNGAKDMIKIKNLKFISLSSNLGIYK